MAVITDVQQAQTTPTKQSTLASYLKNPDWRENDIQRWTLVMDAVEGFFRFLDGGREEIERQNAAIMAEIEQERQRDATRLKIPTEDDLKKMPIDMSPFEDLPNYDRLADVSRADWVRMAMHCTDEPICTAAIVHMITKWHEKIGLAPVEPDLIAQALSGLVGMEEVEHAGKVLQDGYPVYFYTVGLNLKGVDLSRTVLSRATVAGT